LDSGELALEEALEVFERGVGLVRECQELLDEAERRIVELTETSQGIKETEHPSRGA
jgi:exodeoxyribonuclease VII small subunit